MQHHFRPIFLTAISRPFMWALMTLCLFLATVRDGHTQANPQTLNATSYLKVAYNLTSAQILTAQTVPVPIISAPGAGYAIVVDQSLASITYNSATYSSTACGLFYHGTTQVASATMNTLIDAGASQIAIGNGGAITGSAVANIANLGIDFACTTSNPTTGNSPVKLVVTFFLAPL